jgi:CBS domain-containing protein
MKVQDVMTSAVRTCRPDTNLAEAVRDMWEGDCGALPVVNDEGQVTGMITDRDICIALATRGRSADRVAVREMAQGPVHTCLADDDTAAALGTMKANRVRRLPVIDADGHVRGILSLNDVVTHAGSPSPSDVMSTLTSISAHRVPTVVAGVA